MNEYLIRFNDGTMKHIKADSCKFASLSGEPIMVVFYKNNKMHYAITLNSISAIRFPEAKGDV